MMASLLRLHVLLPALLAATFLANALARFLPPEYVSFRGWEAVTLFVTSIGPFAPNKYYFNPRSSGDLSSIANLPGRREFHAETFTTGPAGFRDYDPSWTARQPAAVIFGDSFGAGASVDDRDTLARQVAAALGAPVYFGGYFSPRLPDSLKRQGLRSGVVVVQLSERFEIPAPGAGAGSAAERVVRSLVPDGSPAFYLLRRLRDLWGFSPLEIWASQAYRRLQNDIVLPNVHVQNVDRRTLRDGTEMLFLKSEAANFFHQRPIDVRLVSAMKERIEAAGLKMLIVLVPDKFTVYAPLFRDPVAGPPPADLYINRLERDLRGSGIAVVNCLPSLRQQAAEAILRGQYVYHLDDTHWNAAGIRVAASEILESWPDREARVSDP